jgi:aspartyl-tRNA(Asn)/glutamyl-tRNA(Gln) amidotransferase subunit A
VRIDDGVRRAFRSALEVFASLGAELVEAHPELPNPVDTWNTLTTVDNLASEGPLLETGRVGDDARGLIEPGAEVSGADYVRARNAQWEYACAWGRFMTGYDLLLTPTMECVAYEHGLTGPPTLGGEPIGDFYDDYCHFCYPFNLTGQPAMSVPMGTAEHGLPVGLQIVGRRLQDDVVLRAAAAWERVQAWPRAAVESDPARASGQAMVAAGERVVDDDGAPAEVRRAFSPRDGELVVEYD